MWGGGEGVEREGGDTELILNSKQIILASFLGLPEQKSKYCSDAL